MKSFWVHVLIGMVWVGRLFGQIPEEVVKRERAKVLEGVESVAKIGVPGPVAIWGQLAFPVLGAADRQGNEQAVAAVAGYGKGRVVLFGQNGYLSGKAGGDHAKFLENVVSWSSGGKKKPRVGTWKMDEHEVLERAGFEVEVVKALGKAELGKVDVVVMNAQGVTDEADGLAVVEWVKAGGGLVAGMTGWAFDQTRGGKELALAHGLNRALQPAGIGFTEMSGFEGVQAFAARVELPRLMNASEAIGGMKKAGLSEGEVRQASNAIQIALAAQPPEKSPFREAVSLVLGAAGGSRAVPTKEKPFTEEKENAERMRLSMETRMLRLDRAETVAAHPAHEVFPGKVAANVPRGKGVVAVDATVPGWASTGFYAAAVETIEVTVPEGMAGKGFAVRIGCHSDVLYDLPSWSRAPDITKSVPIAAAVTKVASAFGGLVYIEVPARDQGVDGMLQVGIAGAVTAPLFVLGKDTDEQWNSEIKLRPGPWAELACDKMIVTVPTSVAREVKNPTMVMTFWKMAVEAQDEITNQAAERRRPERMVADVQISAGFMHSGYPIMLHVPEALEMVTVSRLKMPGWGYHHEVGHNHQRGEFTFDGTGEVTNNVIGMWVYQSVMKRDPLLGHPAISVEARKEHVEKIVSAKGAAEKWAVWKGNPFVALTTYIQLIQGFGWESWRAYLHSFADPAFGAKPKTDDETRDQFLIRYSKITKKNLGPFFEYWGIPVSASAKEAVSGMEAWMPGG